MLLSKLNLLATAPDGVAKLRELILTLAVQGKLLPQDPSDEPASVLLKKIRAEKDRLIAEGKIKRDKSLAEIAEEERPFELPVGWEWVRLADVVQVLNGRAYGKQELLDAGTPVLRVGNLFTSNHWYYSNLELEPAKYCEPGDLLYAWSASFGPFIWSGPKAIYHYHIWKLEPLCRDAFDTSYFHMYLKEKTAEIKAAGHGVSMVHMTKEKMEKIVVPYPPLTEQSRIVTRVEDLMRLCDALQAKARLEATQHAQLVATLLGTLTAASRAGGPDASASTPGEPADPLHARWLRVAPHFDLLLDRPEAVDALEQTILQLAVRGHLVPQDPQDEPASALLKKIRAEKDKLIAEGKIKRDKPLPPIADGEKPFDLPQGWEWVRLGSLTSLVTSGSRSWKDYYAEEGATFIRSQDIKYDRLEFDERAFVKLPSGTEGVRTQVCLCDVLITITGANVGKAAVVSELITEAYVSQHVALVRLQNARLVDYLHLWLVSEHEGRKLLLMSSYGAKPGLNLQNINDLLVPLPPLAEQSRIVARVASLRALWLELRQRLTTARTQQALLAQALVQEAA